MNTNQMIKINFRRHGDLNFHPISEAEYKKLKGEIIKKDKVVLQEGETTGHKHLLTLPEIDLEKCEIKKLPDGSWAFKSMGGVLTHEDHKKIALAPAYYRQIREREIDHFGEHVIRQVID